MSEQPETAREYWIAIRPGSAVPLNVFGPYTREEANKNRLDWIQTYPPSAAISAVFYADSRDLANQHAHFYMPRD